MSGSEETKILHVRLPRELVKQIYHFAIEHGGGRRRRQPAIRALLEYAVHAYRTGQAMKTKA